MRAPWSGGQPCAEAGGDDLSARDPRARIASASCAGWIIFRASRLKLPLGGKSALGGVDVPRYRAGVPPPYHAPSGSETLRTGDAFGATRLPLAALQA